MIHTAFANRVMRNDCILSATWYNCKVCIYAHCQVHLLLKGVRYAHGTKRAGKDRVSTDKPKRIKIRGGCNQNRYGRVYFQIKKNFYSKYPNTPPKD